MKKIVLIIGALLLAMQTAFALQVASVFTDHMVLQRDGNVPIWGHGSIGETVAVTFGGQSKEATVTGDGTWRVDLDAMPSNAVGQDLTITSDSGSVTFSNVLVGDIWLAGGQSNMAYALNSVDGAAAIKANAANSQIRFLRVPQTYPLPDEPQGFFSANASWVVSDSGTVGSHSAIGVIFGQRIQPEIGVPVGIITCALGSTAVEAWVSGETLASPVFAPTMAYWNEVLDDWPSVRDGKLQERLNEHLASPGTVSAAYDYEHPSEFRLYPEGPYNQMLHPLLPFAMKGVLWRQGEANQDRAEQYRDLLPVMIAEWRSKFERPNLPFIQAQLPEVATTTPLPGGTSTYEEQRESQALIAQNDPFGEMAVLIDANDPTGNIHPKNKQLDGERMAALALAKVYGQPVPHQGPTYRSMQVSGNEVTITYDHAESGLQIGVRESYTSLVVSNTPAAEIQHFAVAGSDGVFYWADAAIINGTNIVLSAPEVSVPMYVRYAWNKAPAGCNLYNNDGFAAAPFRTDDFALRSAGAVEPKIGWSYLDYSDGKILQVLTEGTGTVGRTHSEVVFFESGAYGVYPVGTEVELSAHPDASTFFGGWSGASTETGAVTTVTVDANLSVTAHFGAPPNIASPIVFDADPVVEPFATVGTVYFSSLANHAADTDGNPILFSLVSGPAWLMLAPDGSLGGSPTADDTGLNCWTIEAYNGFGETNQTLLNITVLPADQHADAVYTWLGTAADGNWSNAANWDVKGIPADQGSGVVGLNGNMLIIFDGANTPTSNIPILAGSTKSDNDTPMIQLRRGSLALVQEVALLHVGSWKDTAGNYNVVEVGNGTDVAQLILDSDSGEYRLGRHSGNQSIHQIYVRRLGEMILKDKLQLGNSDDRFGQVVIDPNGSMVVEGALVFASASPNQFVQLGLGAQFSAEYGGTFTNLTAVQNGFGSRFVASGSVELSAVDNGSTFTVTAQALEAPVEPHSAYVWTGLAGDGNWSNAVNWDVHGIPVDLAVSNPKGNGLNGGMHITFAGENNPTLNIPGLGGEYTPGTTTGDTPAIVLHKGDLTLPVDSYHNGFWKNTEAEFDIMTIGNGTDRARLTLDPIGTEVRLSRTSSTLKVLVRATSELNVTKNLWLTHHETRHGQVTVEQGGSVNVAGTISYKGSDNSFVALASGASVSAEYGGDFVDKAAVEAALSSTFVAGGANVILNVSEIGGTFTVTAVEQAATTPYEDWAEGLSDSNYAADIDHDGMNNLLEYAFGSDPETDDAGSVNPVFAQQDAGGDWVYVYRRRTDAAVRKLSYTVKIREHLMEGTWSTNGITEIESVLVDDRIESVTNRVDSPAVSCFIRLDVNLED